MITTFILFIFFFTWDTPTDSLVLLQEAQGRCAKENLQARLGVEPATSRFAITYADQFASAHPKWMKVLHGRHM